MESDKITKVTEIIHKISQLDDDEIGEILYEISKRVWIPQFMTKSYLETLLDKQDMSQEDFDSVCNDTTLNDKIITFIDEETQMKYS
jgi:tartrate dehydratase alpha subunit/fumarate hydratase class I-like protein